MEFYRPASLDTGGRYRFSLSCEYSYIRDIRASLAGALSMGSGEYVSVSSQADAEKAVLAQERHELVEDKEGELRELTQIYVQRGL